jgi:uncharacterized iron-regulated membrane protein
MNQRLRTAIFWLHLAAGLVAGSVVFIMSVTGVLLMYEHQIVDWADRGYRFAPPQGAARLPATELVARTVAARPDTPPSSVTLAADPEAPAVVGLGRGRNLYLNPYTGEVLGEGSPRVRGFFRAVTDWHRWLAADDEKRDAGKAITGASNLAFLVLVVSGIFLWWPRRWGWPQVKSVVLFRGGLVGKARDFNWHNVIGLWMWLPLFLIVLTGVLISYPWAGNLLYRMTGEEPPARQGGPGGGERRPGGGSGGEEKVNLTGLDRIWEVAERQVPGWETISVRLAAEADSPVVFTIVSGGRGRPDLRAQLTLDREAGEVVKWEPFATQSLARRLRSWGRWVHTGEAGGILGQTLAGLASAGAAVLVWTGSALSYRRFVAWRRRRRTERAAEAVAELL